MRTAPTCQWSERLPGELAHPPRGGQIAHLRAIFLIDVAGDSAVVIRCVQGSPKSCQRRWPQRQLWHCSRVGLASGQEILRRIRPRPFTLVGGLLGAVYAGGAVCPEQGLMLLGLAAFVAFIGLMGEGPQSGSEASKEARTGNSYALVGLLMWKVGRSPYGSPLSAFQ